jgi:hypothetical protein
VLDQAAATGGTQLAREEDAVGLEVRSVVHPFGQAVVAGRVANQHEVSAGPCFQLLHDPLTLVLPAVARRAQVGCGEVRAGEHVEQHHPRDHDPPRALRTAPGPEPAQALHREQPEQGERNGKVVWLEPGHERHTRQVGKQRGHHPELAPPAGAPEARDQRHTEVEPEQEDPGADEAERLVAQDLRDAGLLAVRLELPLPIEALEDRARVARSGPWGAEEEDW